MAYTYLVCGGFAVLVYVVYHVLKLGSRPKGYPPGPPTLPIIGNIHQLPLEREYIQFEKWAKEYGPIYSILLGSQPVIVLSSGEAVKDLLDKRSAIYSDRMDSYIANDIAMGGLNMLFMRYNSTWRGIRKIVHSLLSVTASTEYVPYQTLENKQMLYDMLNDPDDFFKIMRRFATSIATTVTFGWRTPTNDDPLSTTMFHQLEQVIEICQTGPAALLDAFPVLRRMPDWMFPVKMRAKKAFDLGIKIHMKNWRACKREINEGTARPCLCVGLARAQKSDGLSDDLAAFAAGAVFGAGADTTSNQLYGFVQAMLLFQDAQVKAQEELDRVVGPDRLPTMADAQNLPYVRACVKETLRWMPTAVLGAAPHAVTRDDEYMGYKIPKGAGVINNVWAIHMDPARYPEPRSFNPDRFSAEDALMSSADSAAQADPDKRDTFGFGAGRRICQGMHVAERSLFLAISGILWAFTIRPKLDTQGKEILPNPDLLLSAMVTMPEPYQADIKPRSEGRARVIRHEWETASCTLDPRTQQWRERPEETSFNGKTKA